jgi:hypothetical protein
MCRRWQGLGHTFKLLILDSNAAEQSPEGAQAASAARAQDREG